MRVKDPVEISFDSSVIGHINMCLDTGIDILCLPLHIFFNKLS